MRLTRRSVHSAIEPGFKCVATIGNFDGVHLGHKRVIQELKSLSIQYDLPSVVITFEPTPQEFFRGDKAPERLMPFQEKFETLQALGVDEMCVLHFNLELASLSPKTFVEKVLVQGLGVQHLVIGSDFRFGKDRAGDIALLETLGKQFGFTVKAAPLLEMDGDKVSSSRIRLALKAGNLEESQKLLGRKKSEGDK